MKKFKRIALVSLAVVVMTAMSSIAFADSSSKKVKGYGTLYGSLSSSGRYVTSVTYNEDSARLTISGEIQDIKGSTLVEKQTIKSNRGATRLSGRWSNIPEDAYALFGTHGVQDGTKYDSNAVYTYTKANT